MEHCHERSPLALMKCLSRRYGEAAGPTFLCPCLNHLVGDGGQFEQMSVAIAEKEPAPTPARVELSIPERIRLASVGHFLAIQPLRDAFQLGITHEQRKRPSLELVVVGVGVVEIKLVV